MPRVLVLLVIVSCLLASSKGDAQEGPSGRVLRVASTVGTYIVGFPSGHRIAIRDVFIVYRSGKAIGEAMIYSNGPAGKEGEFIVVPLVDADPMRPGDVLVFDRHSVAPKDTSHSSGSGLLGIVRSIVGSNESLTFITAGNVGVAILFGDRFRAGSDHEIFDDHCGMVWRECRSFSSLVKQGVYTAAKLKPFAHVDIGTVDVIDGTLSVHASGSTGQGLGTLQIVAVGGRDVRVVNGRPGIYNRSYSVLLDHDGQKKLLVIVEKIDRLAERHLGADSKFQEPLELCRGFLPPR